MLLWRYLVVVLLDAGSISHWNNNYNICMTWLAFTPLRYRHLSAPTGNEFNVLCCCIPILTYFTSSPELKLFLIPNSHHLAMAKHQHLLIKYQLICPRSRCPPPHIRHQQLHNLAVMVLCMLHHHHHHHHHQPVCIPQSHLSHSQLHI